MQHVANDLLGVLQGLFPGHLDGGCRDSLCPHALRRAGQPISPQHGEARAGLRGARAVLGQALVDGFIRLVDPIDGESAVWGQERDKRHTDCHGPRAGSHGRHPTASLSTESFQEAIRWCFWGRRGPGGGCVIPCDWADYPSRPADTVVQV